MTGQSENPRDAAWRLRRIEAMPSPTPSLRIEAMILRAHVDGTDRDDLVAALGGISYTATEYAPWPHDGAIHGTWWVVQMALYLGHLSREEFVRVRALAAPPDDYDGQL